MSNFRLKVFFTVATNLSFSKASELLFISQPAVSKNIKELEADLDIKLFERKAGKVKVTDAGRLVLDYAQRVLEMEKRLRFDIGTIKGRYGDELKIGASTTVGQYVLPPLLAKFRELHPKVSLLLLNGNTHEIEEALLKNEIEIAVVEGSSKNSQIKYTPYIKDEIVAIVHKNNPLYKREQITLSELLETPVILREPGSGSLEVIMERLKEFDITERDLNIVMHMGSTEGIKTYLANSNCIGLISVNAVTKEITKGEFKILDIVDVEFSRYFYIIHTHGKTFGLAQLFLYFLESSITKSYSL